MAQTETRQENKMGVEPIGKLLLTMSTPMMISMMVQALYNIVDSIFVAMLSEDALTAVSLAFPIQNLMIAFGVGTGVGVNALVSRHLGEKNFKRANSVAVHGLRLAAMHYIIFAVLILLLVRPFFAVQTTDETIASYGVTYTSIVGVLGIGMFAQTMLEKILTSTGKTFYTMITQLAGAITNIIMDPVLIFGLGPFPKMGIAGAAAATIFGQLLGSGLAVYFNVYKNKELQLSLKENPFSLEIVRSIYGVGIPSIFMSAVGSVMTFGLNKILVAFSSTAVAVFGVYFKLQSFAFMPVFGLNNGMMPIIAYNYGAAKPERIMRTIRIATCAAVGLMWMCFLIFQIFPSQLLTLFSASDNMMSIGVPALRIISTHYLVAGVSVISISICQAMRHAPFGLIVSISRQLFVLLPVAFVLSRFGNVNLVWWAFPIAEVVSVILCLCFVQYVLKTEVKPLFHNKEP
ncbi:MAG: MATE family efflux transporter [Lachnospiraceae bacterium]|nr:MATE family efflux transporter [Lachnospiraceae bacterium]